MLFLDFLCLLRDTNTPTEVTGICLHLTAALTASRNKIKNAKFSFVLFFRAYCWPSISYFFYSGANKHQAGGVDEVDQVEDEVDTGEHRHRHRLIPDTQAQRAGAVVRPIFVSAVLGVKVVDGPEDGG